MKLGLPISLGLHGAVIFAGIVTFGGEVEPVDTPEIVPVEILSVADITNIRATIRSETPRPADPELPTTVAEPPEPEPPEPEPPVPPEPRSEPAPSEPTPPEPAAEAEPEPASPEPEPEPEPSFDLDSLSSVVDNARTQQVAELPDARPGDVTNIDEGGQTVDGAGEMTLTQVELGALLRAALTCYDHPIGAPNAASIRVHVGFDIARDGRPSYVSLVAPSSHNTRDPFEKVAQASALRAVEKCGPYDFLPQDRYEAWRTVEVTFSMDPEILGYIEP